MTTRRQASAIAVALAAFYLASCGGSASVEPDGGTIFSGAGGSFITGTSGSGGSSGGGGGVSLDAACVSTAREGEAIPVNLVFLVDRSSSMTCPLGPDGETCGVGANQAPAMAAMPNRWTAITGALDAFVNAPTSAGIGVALQFFPLTLPGLGGLGALLSNPSCNATDYQTPAVGFGVLPAADAPFTMTLAATMPLGTTPTTPALQGAVALAKSQTMMDPSRQTAVVLTSDGIPNGCGSSVANAADAVAAGLAGAPPVKTYVIGVGPQLTSLNQIAAAGGTRAAFLIDTNNTPDQIAAQFSAALDTIAAPIRCDYAIPQTTGHSLDLGTVNVETRVGPSGDHQLVGQVPGASSCGPTGGWFYDDPVAPTKITLCPATCDPLTSTKGSSLQILIGCATQPGSIR